jgi:hypothetical protein
MCVALASCRHYNDLHARLESADAGAAAVPCTAAQEVRALPACS